MFNTFEESARKILINAKCEMKELKHPYVGSEHLLLAILKGKNDVSKKLKEYDLDYNRFKKEIISIVGVGKIESQCFLYTPLLKRILETAMIDSRENNNGNVSINHLFSAMLEEGEGIAIRVMLGMNIDLDDLYKDFSYKIVSCKKNKKLLIDELGIDLTKKALEGELDPVVGRDEEINRILEILSRRKKNNPLLIGEAGVGKTAIVEELSRLIALGKVPYNLKNKRIISLDMATTVAGTKYRGEFEERINKILKELEDNNDIILFIDEIHTLVGAGGAEGAIDASNIFKPALARNKMRLIGATTLAEYKKYMDEDKALERRFQRVNIDAPNTDTVKDILMRLKSTYEEYHHVSINEEMIDLIITLSDKYLFNRNQPDKSIDILDEVCAHVSLKESKSMKQYNLLNKDLQQVIKSKKDAILSNDFDRASELKRKENCLMDKINNLELSLYSKSKERNIKKADIIKIVSRKANVPIYEIDNNQLKNVKNLKHKLTSRIIGQDVAINELIEIYKQIKLGFHDGKCYSMLFAGSSGVGKTELAKIFGKHMSKSVIKLDMSEYSESHSVSKIIGSPAGYVGYNDNKNILEKVKNNPFSVIILDEIEKAHRNIIDLLFQILDDGTIKDSKGEEVSFNNCIIIMTTNIGFEKNNIGFNDNKTNEIKEYFGVPFINRIDNVIMFNKLNEEDIKVIVNNNIKKLRKKYNDYKISVSKSIIECIIDKCNYKDFGARRVSKVINKYIESDIINQIVNNKSNIKVKTLKEKELV